MIPVLRAAGHAVVGLDTYYFEECTLEEQEYQVPSIRKDIRDLTVVDLEHFDAVVHLAALCNDPLGALNEDWTSDINHAASVRLAKLAKEAGVQRFLYSSSCSMYGATGDAVLDEEASLQPLTAYAISKMRTEEDVSKLADANFSPVFMRNATAYGVSPRLRSDLVLNNLVCWAYTTGKIRILSDGTPWRPIVHIEDICKAFAAALVAPQEAIHNQAFNVGIDAENYQIRELAEIVQEILPTCQIEYANGGEPDPRSYRVDFSKITRTLPDFSAKWNATLGVKELYSAFKRAALTVKEFQSRQYIRLEQLKHLISTDRLDSTLRWMERRET